jgi:hypothetical protein
MNLENIITQYDPFFPPDGEEVYLRVMTPDERGAGEIIEVRMLSENGQAICEHALAQILGRLPRTAEVTRLHQVLRGAALQRQVSELANAERESEHEQAESLSALGQVVLDIAGRGGLKADNRDLLPILTQRAQELGLLEKKTRWPRTEDQLGRELSNLIQPLARLSVRLERYHNDARGWFIHARGSQPRLTTAEPIRLTAS